MVVNGIHMQINVLTKTSYQFNQHLSQRTIDNKRKSQNSHNYYSRKIFTFYTTINHVAKVGLNLNILCFSKGFIFHIGSVEIV